MTRKDILSTIIIVIIAAFILIGVIIANRNNSVNERLKNLKLNVPKKSYDAVMEGIEAGKQIAQDEYDRNKQIEDETQDMKDMLSDALTN